MRIETYECNLAGQMGLVSVAPTPCVVCGGISAAQSGKRGAIRLANTALPSGGLAVVSGMARGTAISICPNVPSSERANA